jgi:hypothetical protein
MDSDLGYSSYNARESEFGTYNRIALSLNLSFQPIFPLVADTNIVVCSDIVHASVPKYFCVCEG